MQQPVYLSTDPNAGKPATKPEGYVSTDPTAVASQPAAQAKPSLADDVGKSFKDFGQGLWNFMNPKGLVEMVNHPINTISQVLNAQGDQFDQAKDAIDAGNYGRAAEHFTAWLVPILGPAVEGSIQKIRDGKVSEGLGEISSFLLPGIVKGAAQGAKLGLPVNPKATGAVEFGRSRGIPMDAGTATGNKFVQGVQALSDRTLGGSLVAEKARQAQAEAMGRVGRDLATEAYPKSALSPEAAGRSVKVAVEGQGRAFQDTANSAYDRMRALEAEPRNQRMISVDQSGKQQLATPGKPAQPMGLPVDLRASKATLRPVLERLRRQYPLTQQQSSGGFKALENIVNGPDFAPLSQVDADLGAIKTLARSDNPSFKTPSQGLAMSGVDQLEQAIERTAKEFGQNITETLNAGRRATIDKFDSMDVLKRLDGTHGEDVKAFNQTIERGDAAIGQLRDIQRTAPAELPKLGRAYLDSVLDRATVNGGFEHGQALAASWEKIGPQTKKLLFKDTQYISDLDNFFRLAAKFAENPNPSGTGYTVAQMGQGGLIFTEPLSGVALQIGGYGLSKLLHSPQGVRALTRGLTVPKSNRSASIASVAAITKAAKDAGVEMVRSPAFANSQNPTERGPQ